MDHKILYRLRETYNTQHILLSFNGPFSQGLIEEIGNALKKHLQSETPPSSSAIDVFGVYIEIAQNIQNYAALRNYNDAESSATVVIAKGEDGHYVICAGNIVEAADGPPLVARVEALAALDKTQLKAAYREQLRKPRNEDAAEQGNGAGLGLIDIARKASAPFSCALQAMDNQEVEAASPRSFFSLRVII